MKLNELEVPNRWNPRIKKDGKDGQPVRRVKDIILYPLYGDF